MQLNTSIILTYYTQKNTIEENDFFTQNKDPGHTSPPLNIPLVKISTHECNPENIY